MIADDPTQWRSGDKAEIRQVEEPRRTLSNGNISPKTRMEISWAESANQTALLWSRLQPHRKRVVTERASLDASRHET